jgi:CheY-like chemotaxis protein
MSSANSRILYVDDDSDDRHFFELSLSEAEIPPRLVCSPNAEQALRYLQSARVPELPSLIILDLKMPCFDGKQILRLLKRQPQLASIPVFILSTSENAFEREACRQLGAAAYFVKPFHMDGYRRLMRRILAFMQYRPAA